LIYILKIASLRYTDRFYIWIQYYYYYYYYSRDVIMYARTNEAYGTVQCDQVDATSCTRRIQSSSLHSFDLTHQQLVVRKIGELAKA
jgi:hypothetical protein